MQELFNLFHKVRKNEFVLGIIGLGRVGLPLAAVFASVGVKTIGVDINKSIIEKVKNGIAPFYEPGLNELLKEVVGKHLFVTDNINDVHDKADIFIIAVGTPLSQDLYPDNSYLISAISSLGTPFLKGKMIILRSTTAPGTLEEIVKPILERRSGFKAGIDFGLAVCPERIVEGKALDEIRSLPEIVGALDDLSAKITSELFRKINPNKKIIFTVPKYAELAKLFTNAYRYVNFALANEFALLAEEFGADAFEVIRIANEDYPRGGIPIPGLAGGPCLSKDGYYLLKNQVFLSIISVASRINEFLPLHIVNKISKELRAMGMQLTDTTIGILGIAYKKDIDDVRYSPAEKLARLFQSYGARTLVHDPYVAGTFTLEDVLKNSDVIVLAVNHSTFIGLEEKIESYPNIKLVCDCWGIFDAQKFKKVKYLRLGRGNTQWEIL